MDMKKCLVCGVELETYDKWKSHIKWTHNMPMKEYRLKYAIPVIAHNRVGDAILTKVVCHICGKEFNVESKFYRSRIKKGKNRFACSKECKKKLQSITIGETRSSVESRAKTARATKEMWASIDKDKHIQAMKEGMANSKFFKNRNIVAANTRAEARKINPGKYSDAMKRAWDTRGRVPHTIVEFKCDGCGINVKRDLNASGLKAFQIEKYHFCSLLCNRQHLTRKALEITAEMDVRNCLICSKEIVRPKAYFDYHKDYRGFFCCSNHQRQFLSLYGLPESAIKTIKEFRSTQVFAERPNNKEKLLIPMLEPMGFSYCGNGTFRVGKINPDFINERKKIVAEHYGCWWHRCPTCYPDREQEIQLTARVAYRDSVYVSAGYKHIVIWEHELNDPAWQSNLLAKIGKFLA